MTKKSKIIICVLLALTMICSVFFAALCLLHIIAEDVGIYVADVAVTRINDEDVLGDGTVYYDSVSNTLTFDNATIETDTSAVFSTTDLNIMLIGENKFICRDSESIYAIYAGDNLFHRDLLIGGDGSLEIEFRNADTNVAAIFADDLTIQADVAITTPDSKNIVNTIQCYSSLTVANKATVTVNSGSGKHCSGVRVHGNVFLEEGTLLNISVKPGAVESCKGFSINGDLILRNNAALNVAIDDENAKLSECIRVTGLIGIESGSTITASSKDAHAIECYGSIKANEGTAVSAVSDKEASDILCYGAVVNYGAEIDAGIEAIGGVRNKAEN